MKQIYINIPMSWLGIKLGFWFNINQYPTDSYKIGGISLKHYRLAHPCREVELEARYGKYDVGARLYWRWTEDMVPF